uniref:Sodium-coupled monocarboxylate transporter 1 n=1 Tax=Magallana gigas TaxID=29159 RepID=K1RBN0_MAGGI
MKYYELRYKSRYVRLLNLTIGCINYIVPFMVLQIFEDLPGMSGLFIASLFSASLSTLSSGLSSLSALAIEDVVKPNFKSLSERTITLIAKISVVFIGALCVAVSFLIAKIKGPMSQVNKQ